MTNSWRQRALDDLPVDTQSWEGGVTRFLMHNLMNRCGFEALFEKIYEHDRAATKPSQRVLDDIAHTIYDLCSKRPKTDTVAPGAVLVAPAVTVMWQQRALDELPVDALSWEGQTTRAIIANLMNRCGFEALFKTIYEHDRDNARYAFKVLPDIAVTIFNKCQTRPKAEPAAPAPKVATPNERAIPHVHGTATAARVSAAHPPSNPERKREREQSQTPVPAQAPAQAPAPAPVPVLEPAPAQKAKPTLDLEPEPGPGPEPEPEPEPEPAPARERVPAAVLVSATATGKVRTSHGSSHDARRVTKKRRVSHSEPERRDAVVVVKSEPMTDI